MFEGVTQKYLRHKDAHADDDFIRECVMNEANNEVPDEEDVVSGDDSVDEDSVPDEVVQKIDSELDKIVDNPEYDDAELDELMEEDDEINELIDEAVNCF